MMIAQQGELSPAPEPYAGYSGQKGSFMLYIYLPH